MASGTPRDIVLAAARRMSHDGRQVTMANLAAAGGIGVRTLYRLFGSRETLLREAGCEPEPGPRERVLQAALEEVGRNGLDGLSMDDLAATAGISRATLYRLYPGKPALFTEVIRSYSPWESVAEVLNAMPDDDPEDVIPAVTIAIAESLHGRTALLLRIVFELIQKNPDTVEGMQHGLVHGLPDLVRYLSTQMETGRIRTMDPILAAQLLAGPIVTHELTAPLARALDPTGTTSTDPLDEITQAWLRAMAPTT